MRFLLAAALLLAACGDHVAQVASGATPSPTAGAATPVPWSSAPPWFPPPASPTIAPIPTGVARCDPKTLRLTDSSYQGAMGSLYGASSLVHDGTGCLVAGDFTVRFIDRRGTVVLTAASPSTPEPLNPGWAIAGRAVIAWQILWCDRSDPVVAVEVDYEGSAYRDALTPLVGGAACDANWANGVAPHGGAVVMYPLGPRPTNPPPLPAPALRPMINAPAQVRAGDVVTYVVTLTNTSARTVALDPCPNYIEWLVGPVVGTEPTPEEPAPKKATWPPVPRYAYVAKEPHALNCVGVAPLEPDASVQFEMQLVVPSDAAGAGTLRWQLTTPIASAPAEATVMVVPR